MEIKPEELADTIMEDFMSIVRGISVEASNRMIDKVPVASGKLRASIRAAVNSEDISFGADDTSGGVTKAGNEAAIMKAKAGDQINIVVGAPYGAAVEQGTDSRQPVGFILTTGEEHGALLQYAASNKDRYK